MFSSTDPLKRGLPRSLGSLAAAAILASLPAEVALAQSTADEADLAFSYGDKPTVSIATGNQLPVRRAPAVATVITASDIAAMGAEDLDDVLEAVPGIHVSRSDQGYSPLYLIRGISSAYNPQTLMLQNGVPMTTLFVGNRGNTWYGLPLENIARIEIIRGPGSALYGADAYSGVINVITKTAADIQGTELGVRAGSFQSRNAWALHGGKVGPIDVAAYVAAGHTDGFNSKIDSDKQTGIDQLTSTQVSLAPGPVHMGYDSVDGNVDLSLGSWRWRSGYKFRNNTQAGPGVLGALDPVGRGKSERITSDLSWTGTDVFPHWDVGATASYMFYTQEFFVPFQLLPPGSIGFINGMFGAPNTWEDQTRLSLVASYRGWANHMLRFGVGHDDLDLYRTQEIKNFSIQVVGPNVLLVPFADQTPVEVPESASFMTPHRRIVDYVYAQDEWRVAQDWTLTGGVRQDQYSDFGRTLNPRAALVWDASDDLTAKILYGRAFRAPAFTELYSINNPVVRGNPDLRPETINTWETSLAWQARADMDVNISLYRYEMNDIIRVSNLQWNNTGAQTGRGLELDLNWKLSRRLSVQGNYAWQRATDEVTKTDAGFAPHHHLFGRLDWNVLGAWMLGVQCNYVADRKRAAGDMRPQVPDYTTVDLNIRSSASSKGWTLSGGVRNLLNADAREPLASSVSIVNDLPLPKRSFFLQATYRM